MRTAIERAIRAESRWSELELAAGPIPADGHEVGTTAIKVEEIVHGLRAGEDSAARGVTLWADCLIAYDGNCTSDRLLPSGSRNPRDPRSLGRTPDAAIVLVDAPVVDELDTAPSEFVGHYLDVGDPPRQNRIGGRDGLGDSGESQHRAVRVDHHGERVVLDHE